MKILHTSDWHLGKKVNNFPMLEDQKYILDQIVAIVQEERPDAIIIAGDVYHTSTPAAEAVSVLDHYISRLHALCGHVFVLSGNHDSAERIAFGSEIMGANGVHFSQVFSATPQQISLRDEHGEVHFYMLPFVRPMDVRSAFANDEQDQPIDSYDAAIRKAIEAMQPDYTQRNILIAHQYIQGAERCDGEETVGGLDEVDAAIVKDFDYVALGHLHGPQHVQYPHIRYSGSPLKYSFSEVAHRKSVTLIECGEKGNLSIRERYLTPLHDWSDLRGTYDELMSEAFYKDKGLQHHYVRITLTDENDIVDAMRKLQSVYPLAVTLQYDNTRTRSAQDTSMAEQVDEMTPMQIVSEFYAKQNGQPMTAEQENMMSDLINSLFA